MKRWIKYYFPSYLWAVLIFIGSSLVFPISARPGLPIDKLGHFVEFAVFGLLLARSFKNAETPIFRKYFVILAVIICALYGLSDEFHQSFVPQRGFEMFDILVDFIGGILGALVYIQIIRRRS